MRTLPTIELDDDDTMIEPMVVSPSKRRHRRDTVS
jgi:hypothetical protein